MTAELQEIIAIGGVLLVVGLYLFSKWRKSRKGGSGPGCSQCPSPCEEPVSLEKSSARSPVKRVHLS